MPVDLKKLHADYVETVRPYVEMLEEFHEMILHIMEGKYGEEEIIEADAVEFGRIKKATYEAVLAALEKMAEAPLTEMERLFFGKFRHRIKGTLNQLEAYWLDLTHIADGTRKFLPRFPDVHSILVDSHFGETVEMEKLPLRDSISRAINRISKNFPKDTHFVLDVDDWNVEVEHVEKITEETIYELLNNAIRALPETGGIVEFSLKVIGKNVIIAVTDNGSGIKSEDSEHVGKVGFTTRPEKGGTGNGLSLVKEYVKKIGGSFSIESAGADQGTTATIILPLAS